MYYKVKYHTKITRRKNPPAGQTGGCAAVTLPFLQLKLGRKVSGDSPPAVTLPFLQLELGRKVSGGLLSLSKSAVAISAGRRADSPRKEFAFHLYYTANASHEVPPCYILTSPTNLRQHRTKSVWRLCTPSACKFPVIFHKNAREYIKYSLRFLFHLTENLTTHLSHNLCAVLP